MLPNYDSDFKFVNLGSSSCPNILSYCEFIIGVKIRSQLLTCPTVSPTTAEAEAAAAWAEAEAAAALPAAVDPPWAIPARPGTAGSLGRLSEGDIELSFGRLAAYRK